MPETKVKIAFVHNAYIEYRTPLFQKISDKYDVNFFFEWFDKSLAKNKFKFNFRFLKSITVKGGYSFSPMLFYFLLKGKYNLFIAGAIGDVNTYVTYLVSRILRKPFIFWDENWYLPQTKLRVLAWPLIISTLRNANAIVVPGSKSKDYYLKLIPLASKKIFLAPNVSLLPRDEKVNFKANQIRTALKLSNKKVILYCGRLIKQKGFEYLLEAFKKLQQSNPETFLLVVGGQYGIGDNYSLKELKNSSAILVDEKIRFTGWVETDEKAAYFQLAEVVVVPSIFFAEGAEVWGFAVNEALSSGKPVIATKAVGSAYDLIQDGINGYIVPDKNPVALFGAIKSIIDNRSVQKRMSAQSLRILNSGFTYDDMKLGFVNAIEYAISINRSFPHSKKEAKKNENTDH